MQPPADASLGDVFESWLPETFARVTKNTGMAFGSPRVRISVSGPKGGAWDLQLTGRTLEVQTADKAAPDVWLRQSEADFWAILRGDVDLPELLPPGWTIFDLVLFDGADDEFVRRLQGRILFEVHGKRRRRWALDLSFGRDGVSAGRPKSTVSVDGATFDGIRQRTLPAVQALMERRIRVDGDRGLALQLALWVGSRLGKKPA